MKFVAEELPPSDILVAVLTVPLLVLVLCCLTGFRRGETDPVFETFLSLITVPRRRRKS